MDQQQNVNLSSSDVEMEPAQTPALSSSDVEMEGTTAKPAGPVNPYAKPGGQAIDRFMASQRSQPDAVSDLSGVPGADPGMQTPMAAGSARPDAIVPAGAKPIPGWDLSFAPKGADWHPVDAAKQVGEGVKNLAESKIAGVNLANDYPTPASIAVPTEKPNVNQAAKGATQAMQGTMEATKPLMVPGIAAAPFRAALLYGTGIAAGKGAQVVAKEMGATPEEQEFFHTLGFFLPDVAVKAAGVESFTETQGHNQRAGVQAFGGKVKVQAARNPEAVGVAGQVGKTRFGWAKQRDAGVNVSDQGPAPGMPAPPSTQEEQVSSNTSIAARAAKDTRKAKAEAGMAPPPPKPGEPGSTEMPAPAGMDDGVLTMQTVDNVGKGIQSLPPEMKGKGVIETVTNLAKWIAGKGTIVGPDNRIQQVTGQSPQAQQQSASTIATKLVNDEVDRQAQQAEEAAKQKQEQADELAKQQKEQADTAKEEEQQAIAQTTEGSAAKKPAAGEAPTVDIPNSRQVDQARDALRTAPRGATAEQMEKVVRNAAMVTMPVRKALVQEEISRRANAKEQTAETAMTGNEPAEGLDRESLQAWADKANAGEHPYVFVPEGSTFKPNGVEEAGLVPTKVKDSKFRNPDGKRPFNGTYYHADDIKPGDIREAARGKDGGNPQDALDKLVTDWKNQQSPVELGGEDVEHVEPETKPAEEETKPAETETAKASEAPATTKPKVEVEETGKPDQEEQPSNHVEKGEEPKVQLAPKVEKPTVSTAPVEFKPGQKVLVKQADGTEKERAIAFKHPNGKFVVKGEKKTVAGDQMRPADASTIAKPAEQEENTSHGQREPQPAGIDQTGGGRPAADSGSSDRGGLAEAPSEVPEVAPESEGADQGNSPAVREGAPPVPEQGTGTGPGTGSDTGLDNSPAKPVIDEAKKKAAKTVTLNKDWYTHPDSWQVPGGEVTRLEGNLKALRILRDVEKNPRKLTEEEQQALANYVGWGALQSAFDPYKANYSEQGRWRQAYQELQKLLSTDEFEAARRSTTNAHYTSPEIVRWMWEIAGRFGFKGGNVLEPSMGVGNFFGMMPKSIRAKAHAVGNELDPVTYGIAKLLYPSATLFNKDFKDLIIPDNEIDFAIGNVPFGDWSIYDPKYPKLKAYIHDYFMVKTLDKVKPGGVVAFITSTGTMDKANDSIRTILASKADLVGAFRLPSSAFAKNAGTSVTTDLIILKKRALGEKAGGEAWLSSPETMIPKDDESGLHPLNVNEYFQEHPENMLGVPSASTRMYGSVNFMLQPHAGKPMAGLLKDALGRLPKGIMLESNATGLDQASTDSQYASDALLEHQYTLDDKGNIKQRINGKLVIPPVLENKDGSLNPAKIARLKEMIGIRGTLNELLSAMATMPDNEEANSQIAAKRTKLKQAYDRFTKKYGLLNSPTNRVFQEDPHFPRLLALEHYDRAARTSTPADIFTRRTIFPREPLRTVSADAKEALQQILAERGFPDVNTIARLQGTDPKDVAAELVKQGLIFRDPDVGDYQTREKYLSGYVRDKLRTAQAAVAQGMKEYEPNVKALEAVIPADIEIGDDPATSVSVRPGATWVPLPAIESFFRDTFRTEAKIINAVGNWSVELKGRPTPELLNSFGTPRVAGDQLLQDCLNLKQTTVYDRFSDGTSALNQKDTTLAQAQQERIRQEFQKWASRSAQWKGPLTRAYNDAYNNLVSTEYDGSHLTFPGMNSSVLLKPHQVNAVWRLLQDGRGLLAHEVGAGKTFEMAAAIMEGRRVGTFKKPLLTVPNHIVEQFRKEFLHLYPGANLLVPTEKDFDSRNRQRIMSHIATGDYDAIILPHSQFNLMDISAEHQRKFVQEEMEELEETIRAIKQAKGEKRTIKQLEKSKEKLRTRLAELMDLKADRAINFDDTGIDTLFVDEAHNFKNLSFYTKMTRVAGLQQAKAKSASRLKMKTRFLQDTHSGRGVVFATGTPVQNTMAELYTMIKYVAPDVLERAGIRFFDDWAANFGSTITAMELSADGRSYKARTKFARFQNVPELMQMFRSFADIKTAADLDLPRPELETGKPIVITVPASPILESFVQSLMKRAEAVRGGGVDPKRDNMLKITTDGRKAATDMRLLDPSLEDNLHSKINTVVERMYREWEEGKADSLTQMGFLDLYRTTDDADHEVLNLYNDMRNKLVGRGVPRDEIAVVSEHDTRIKRQALFDKVNKGIVRVLLGSTQRMGAGTNAQVKLKTLHHIDLTWRPGDLQQRDGRILRQGNTNKDVRILTYLTEKSFDAYMAQTLQGKAEFISQIFSGRNKSRVMVDAAADMVLSLEEMKIAASGNPDVKLKYDLEMQRQQLGAIERGFESQKREAKYQAEHADLKATDARTRLKRYGDALAKVEAIKGEDGKGFELKVDGKTFTDRKQGLEYLKAMKVPEQNFWLDFNGIGISVKVAQDSGTPVFAYDTSYGVNGYPPDRTMESLGNSVEATVRNLSNWVDKAKAEISNAEGDAARFREIADSKASFPEKAQLDKVNKQLEEVEKRLGLGKVNEGSQADGDAVAADAEAETPDKEIAEKEETEDDEEEDDDNSTWGALGSEEGSVVIPPVFEKAGEWAGKAVATTLKDAIEGAKLGGRTAKAMGRDIIAALYPRALASDDAVTAISHYTGDQALSEYQTARLLDAVDKMFSDLPDYAQVRFMDHWMKGEAQPNEEWKQAQDLMSSLLDGQHEMEELASNLGRKPGKSVPLASRENYFPLRYKKRPGGEADVTSDEQMSRIATPSKRPLEGTKGFTKQKKYLTASDALAAGGVFAGSPVDMVKQRMADGMKFVTAKYMWQAGKDTGEIRFLKQGKKMPADFARVDDKIVKVVRPVETEEGGTLYQKTGEWIVQKDFARLINNYLSRNWFRDTSFGRGLVALKNASTAAGFAFSPFHWMGMVLRNWSGALQVGGDRLWNQGVRNLDSEATLKGLEDMGRAVVAPWSAHKFGQAMTRYARNPDEFLETKEGRDFVKFYPSAPQHMKGLFRGGLRWGQPEIYKANTGAGFISDMKSGHLGRGALKAFPWLTYTVNTPLFEHYVPASKWFYAIRMAVNKFDENSGALASGDMTADQIYREVASATENQFGELHLENFNWNNTTRSAMQMLFRSASWKVGTWGTAVNAVKEFSTMFNDDVFDKIGEEGETGGARKFTRKLPKIGTNQGSLISLMFISAVLGTIMAKLASGKWPWEHAEDDHAKLHLPYLGALAYETAHPQTGMLNHRGEPLRFSLPSDLKDYEHAWDNPRQYVASSRADLLSNAWDTLENEDAYKNYVFNPHDPLWKELTQAIRYNLAGDFEPYVARPYVPLRPSDDFGAKDWKSKVERSSGLFGNPPKSFGRSTALNEAIEDSHAFHRPLTPEQQTAQELTDEHPTRAQARHALKTRKMDELERVFVHLTYSDAKQVYEDATDEEKRELAPLLRRKQENMMKRARR